MRKSFKKCAFILTARDDFAVLAFVVAKAPYSHKNDRYTLALLQTRI